MAKKSKSKPSVHQIRSFQDLNAILTEENADMIMGNFYGCVKAFLSAKNKHPELEMTGFDWIDDGKIEVKEANVTFSQRFRVAVQ